MEYATLPLPLFLLVIAVLVLISVIGTRSHWMKKLCLVVLVPLSTLIVWRAVGTYRGWPTTDEMPAQFQVIGAEVKEPGTPNAGPFGMIFIWVYGASGDTHTVTVLGYHATLMEPRAYRLPYTRKLHEQIDHYQELLCQGRPVFGKRNQMGSENRNHRRPSDRPGEGGGDEESDIELYELPPGQPMPKNP